MLSFDYLTQRLVRLKSSEAWDDGGHGLSFVFVKRGKATYVSKPATHELAPGDLLVASASARGKLSVSGGPEAAFHYFSACLEHMIVLFAAKDVHSLQTVTECFKGAKLYRSSSPLAKRCHALLDEAPPQVAIGHRSHLLGIVACVLTEELKLLQPQRSAFVAPEDHMAEVFEQLASVEIFGLSVEELAQKFNCSPRHLNRLFHQRFGVSMCALKMEMRLLKAITLLQDPDAKIINIAEHCGFNHLGHFNTSFKKRFGTNPTQWRKRLLPDEEAQPGPRPRRVECFMRKSGLCPQMISPDGRVPAVEIAGGPFQSNPASSPPNGRCVAGLDGQPAPINPRNRSPKTHLVPQ